MMSLLNNIHVIAPEAILLLTACTALLADLFIKKYSPNISLIISLIGLVFAAAASAFQLGNFKVLTLGGLFISDDLAQLMNLFICITVFMCFIYSHDYVEERQMPAGDYYVLGLFSTLGMLVLVSAHSLLTIYLGIELLSLPLYAMTAIRRTNSDAAEAAMKYFVMGAIASGMILYGFSLLYGSTGKLDLLEIANVISINWQQHNTLLTFAVVFILAGVGFKLAAVPYHMWAPDVYQGAPTSVTLLLSTAPKIAAMAMLIRILSIGLMDVVAQWQQIIVVMALLSAGFGNLLAVAQTNIKRLFAYSAIAHIGYALFGVLAATHAGFSASVYYILVYALMTAAAFGLITLLSRSGIEINDIDDLKGLNKRHSWLAFMMLIVLFSMTGVPPTVGFFTKFMVLKSLVDVHMTWVATTGLLFAVVGAFYYIRMIKIMYFDEPVDCTPIKLPVPQLILFSGNSLSLLYFGLFPSVLLNACISAFAN